MLIWKRVFGKYTRNQKRYDQGSFGKMFFSTRYTKNHENAKGEGAPPSAEMPFIQINPVSLYLLHSVNFPAFTVLPSILYYKAETRHNPLRLHHTKIRSK